MIEMTAREKAICWAVIAQLPTASTLITHDAHFSKVKGLEIETW